MARRKKRRSDRRTLTVTQQVALRRRRLYYNSPMAYMQLRTQLRTLLEQTMTEDERKQLRLDGRTIFRVGGGEMDIAIKGRNLMLLFYIDGPQVAWVFTGMRMAARYYPNLGRTDADLAELELFLRLMRELQLDKNFRHAEEVAEF